MTTVSRRDLGALSFGAAFAAAAPAWAQTPHNWRVGFQTPLEELDSELTLISGRVPRDLEGALFRVGPAQFERGGARLGHWFDGDGMVQRFSISDGRVRHRGRFVATDKRRTETAAGRFLYSGYGFSPDNPTSFNRADEINAANTNVLTMGGELWTLWEGGSPWRVQSESLETVGRQAFAGPLDGAPFSAHPKRDLNGEIWNFGVFGSHCVIWRLAPDGRLISATPIELPAAAMMHDFAITRRHIVLLAPPMLMHAGPARSLVDRYAWRNEEPNALHLRGELRSKLGETDQADADFRAAIELARQIGTKPPELRAATSLAQLWQAQGKSDEARALLAPIYGWFTDGFDTRDLTEAKEQLEALAG